MKHPNSRAERLRLKEIKNEKKSKASEKRLERLQRKALLSRWAQPIGWSGTIQKETPDGAEDYNEGDING